MSGAKTVSGKAIFIAISLLLYEFYNYFYFGSLPVSELIVYIVVFILLVTTLGIPLYGIYESQKENILKSGDVSHYDQLVQALKEEAKAQHLVLAKNQNKMEQKLELTDQKLDYIMISVANEKQMTHLLHLPPSSSASPQPESDRRSP